jgi:hypothetical protein
MSIPVVTIDIGNLYQDSGKIFCLSPRSKDKSYQVYTVLKPLRLLHLKEGHIYNDDDLELIISRLNAHLYNLDGCLIGSKIMSIWLSKPSMLIYKDNIVITQCSWDDEINTYIVSSSYLNNKDKHLIEVDIIQ